MASFEIKGGRRLKGEIVPQGAKNEALQVLCAVLLTGEKVRIENVPDIRDINKLIDILKLLGVGVREDRRQGDIDGRTFEFEASDVNLDMLDSPEFASQASALRGSIMLVGPLLARFQKAGEEYASALSLSAETVAALEKPMIPAEEYIRIVNGQ